MGNGDIQNNANNEVSVKEDLFEAILGAVAIDCNWNMTELQSIVEIMLNPDCFYEGNADNNYVALIQEWTLCKNHTIPLYHFKKASYDSTWYYPFDGISQRPKYLNSNELFNTKYHCLLKISDTLPIFRGFGNSKSEARHNVCKLAYEYLTERKLLLSISDEIDNPNQNDSINQLEILARRGYFSIPTYNFCQKYDNDGNPIWECQCYIPEYAQFFSAKASSKKTAKKASAFKMLEYVLQNKQ